MLRMPDGARGSFLASGATVAPRSLPPAGELGATRVDRRRNPGGSRNDGPCRASRREASWLGDLEACDSADAARRAYCPGSRRIKPIGRSPCARGALRRRNPSITRLNPLMPFLRVPVEDAIRGLRSPLLGAEARGLGGADPCTDAKTAQFGCVASDWFHRPEAPHNQPCMSHAILQVAVLQ